MLALLVFAFGKLVTAFDVIGQQQGAGAGLARGGLIKIHQGNSLLAALLLAVGSVSCAAHVALGVLEDQAGVFDSKAQRLSALLLLNRSCRGLVLQKSIISV